MAFRFNLESVLKHRKRLEDVAQREFAEAQAAVEECLQVIEGMYRRLDEVREEVAAAQNRGLAHDLEEIRASEQFIYGHKIRIEQKRLEARRLMQVAKEKQEALIAAARERKILTKLKDKRLAEYKEWLNRIDAKAQDDMTMVRHGWGKR